MLKYLYWYWIMFSGCIGRYGDDPGRRMWLQESHRKARLAATIMAGPPGLYMLLIPLYRVRYFVACKVSAAVRNDRAFLVVSLLLTDCILFLLVLLRER